MEFLFFLSIFFLLHTYAVFPLSLPLLADLFQKKVSLNLHDDKELLPAVSLIVSAYNEEDILEEKIRNSLALDYPAEKLEIIFGNDGSTDRTVEILESWAEKIIVIPAEKNRGKAAMLNLLEKRASSQVLVFCDANTLLLPNALRKLVLPFRNKKTGCVSGRLILTDRGRSTLGQGEAAYWNMETEAKKFEGRMNVVIGSNGALYAIRKDLYTKLPEEKTVMDDFFISTAVLQKGYNSTYMAGAIGTETTSTSSRGEFERKIRIGKANFNYLSRYLSLLNPLHPLVAYFFLSHKLLRWFSPHLLISMLISNALLLDRGFFFVVLMLLQALFYALAITGRGKEGNRKKWQLSAAPYYFLSMNIAMLLGFFKALKPGTGGAWQRIDR